MKWDEIKWWIREIVWASLKCRTLGHQWHSKRFQHIDYKECQRCGAVIPVVMQHV